MIDDHFSFAYHCKGFTVMQICTVLYPKDQVLSGSYLSTLYSTLSSHLYNMEYCNANQTSAIFSFCFLSKICLFTWSSIRPGLQNNQWFCICSLLPASTFANLCLSHKSEVRFPKPLLANYNH